MRETLNAVIAAMPNYEGPALQSLMSHPAISLAPREADGYITPDVRVRLAGQPGPIHLVTAPGAMGKSAAALAIAARLSAVYIDLASMQVGTGTLTGELTKALGWEQAPAFVTQLKAGRASLVLDSTDEAQLAAGRDNYIAFLGDLAWLLSDAKPSHQVVLLGRPDSVDTTYVELLDLGFDAPIREVAPLSLSQARNLIDSALDRTVQDGRPFVVHRHHAEPFGELRDAVFTEVALSLDPAADGLDSWPVVENFLGYPPVLLAIAERLAVDNPKQELQNGAAASIVGKRKRQGELLQKVLEDILDRESGKVKVRLGDRLAMRKDDELRAVLYTRDEQVARMLVHSSPLQLDVNVPAILTPADRAKYEEEIESFLRDHPFLVDKLFANVVFSDYARAWAVTSPAYSVYSGSRSQFLRALPKVGPFFAHFVHSMSQREQVGILAEDLLDDVLHSFALGAIDGRAIYVHRDSSASLALYGEDPLMEESGSLFFRVEELSGVAHFSSPIARFTCLTSHGVVLSGAGGNLNLGPGVAIVAESLEIHAQSVVAYGSARSPSSETIVMLSAASVDHPSDMKVAAFPENTLYVTWADAWHQWKPYAIQLPTSGVRLSADVSSQILLGLRRILMSFGSSAAASNEPSVLDEKIERFAIGSNRVFQAVFEALQNLNVIQKVTPLYRLRLEELGRFGVSWAAMRADPGRALEKLHIAVARDSAFDGLREGEPFDHR